MLFKHYCCVVALVTVVSMLSPLCGTVVYSLAKDEITSCGGNIIWLLLF